MNTLRLWGGGVILPRQMYDLADELGIMLSLEFPLANSWPETDDVFLGNLDATITSIIKQTRNHPSIIEWTGGNEMPWQQGTDHPALHLMQRLVDEHDGRIFRATCPIQGSHPHGPWTFDPASRGFAQAYNDGFAHYNQLSIMRHGEFGAPSPANLETWQRTIPPEFHDARHHLDHRIIRRKKIVYAVFGPHLWMTLPQLDYFFGPSDDLPTTIAAGQFLGAQALRYAMSSHRLHGDRMGGFMSWNYNEPWPNGAGSYMVDYYGRPLMNYDFVTEALAPITLALKHDSMLYDPKQGINAQLYMVSDAPKEAYRLQWQWLARDRRGQVIARQSGTGNIQPRQVLLLDTLAVQPPEATALGPVFVELTLRDGEGQILTESLHVFVAEGSLGSLRGLLVQDVPDEDDTTRPAFDLRDDPTNADNLAYVGNGAKPATASSSHALDIHQPAGLNDGKYGNDHSWLGGEDGASFTIDLNRVATLGAFHLGRDRTSRYSDRLVDRLKLETSVNGEHWQTVFEQDGLATLPGIEGMSTLQVAIPPVDARFVRGTVHAAASSAGQYVCIDEFEVYGPQPNRPPVTEPVATILTEPLFYRPVTRTTLALQDTTYHTEDGWEYLSLTLQNTGRMTALFCSAHPMLEYRTDVFIENNHAYIPPGESRTIAIRAAHRPDRELTLKQMGWQVRTWNADDVTLEPDATVLLAIGRRDAMSYHFKTTDVQAQPVVTERFPDVAAVPHMLSQGGMPLTLEIELDQLADDQQLWLQLDTADRSDAGEITLEITTNDKSLTVQLPAGYGFQKSDPVHLAQPAGVSVQLPSEAIQPGRNRITLRVTSEGWLTWDALRCVTAATP